MSEYKRANSFGEGYLDVDKCFKMKIENKTKKRHFEVAGDEKAMKAFGEIPLEAIAYKYNSQEKKMLGVDGKDFFHIEITDPDGNRMLKTCTYDHYMNLIRTYSIVTEGKWKEWKKDKSGNPIAVRVQE